MRADFCAFILTHGRPDRVFTYDTFRATGYSGPIFLVVDDEDPTLAEYQRRFGECVLVFSKSEAALTFDEGDNFPGRRGVVYARNVCWELARSAGFKYFIQLDDDYRGYYYRSNGARAAGVWRIDSTMDELLEATIEFLEASGALTVAFSQGGDHIGGNTNIAVRRKAMNTFVCSVDRQFQFVGRINEDTTTYTVVGRVGGLFFTVLQAQVNQLPTQSNAGGLTDLYLDLGTYVKSFYSVMYAPSCVKVGYLGDPRSPHIRLHHSIDWVSAVPCILREAVKKSDDA